jgi:hypothetical protein
MMIKQGLSLNMDKAEAVVMFMQGLSLNMDKTEAVVIM